MPTGTASPGGAVTNAPYQVTLNYLGVAPIVVSPIFTGLTRGYAGLYQVNFKLPPLPAGTLSCQSTGNNLTVTISNIEGYEPLPGFYNDPVVSDSFSLCANP